MKKIGVFGGTFSPPHSGHVNALGTFLRVEKPDLTIAIPTYTPPHKTRKENTSAEDRLEMAKLAFGIFPGVEVSDLEIRRGGKSYTSVTLEQLHLQYGKDARLVLLCGTDMLATLAEWHEPQTIFALADVVCMVREADNRHQALLEERAAFYKKEYGGVVRFLPVEPLEMSSTEIREALLLGQDHLAEKALPTSVWEYIQKKGLYRG